MSDMNALFMRVCEMNVAGRLLTSPPMTLEFEYEFSAKEGMTHAKAKIYNPAPATIDAAKKDAIVTVSAGYQGDYGSVFTGIIAKPELAPGRDSILSLTLSDASERFAESTVNFSIRGQVSALSAARTLLTKVGITSAKIELANNVMYNRGITFRGSFRSEMTKIAKDTGSQFFFRQGQCCIIAPEKGVTTAWELSSDTGLLSAVKIDGGYKLRTLYLYRIGAGSLISLKQSNSRTLLRVSKGKLSFTSKGNGCGAEFEAVRL